ncbi:MULTISPECIES: hypothetical protein [unclassified Pseudomonas]|uniref:hypothetical protein n=1 Tax=unclassified Pseudomonas TaxID=196821 RepID=UPI00131DD7E8|nr:MULTISPECIES: hypothetical protein [unclassified Pseudomonas]
MHPIIAGEVRKAEALLEGYLGLPPDSIDLASINLTRFKGVSSELTWTVSSIQDLIAANSFNQRNTARFVNLVDKLAVDVQQPRGSRFSHVFYAINRNLNKTKPSFFLQIILPVLASGAGIAYLHDDRTEVTDLISCAAVAIIFAILIGAWIAGRAKNSASLIAFLIFTVAGAATAILTGKTAQYCGLQFLISIVPLVHAMVQGNSISSDRKNNDMSAIDDLEKMQDGIYNPYRMGENYLRDVHLKDIIEGE